jgi:hypothetical protein
MTEHPPKKSKSRRVGQVIARGDNKFLIAIFRSYKPSGTNDYFYKTFHGPKKEAEKWLRGALACRDRGEPLEDPDITFEALFNEWLESKKNKHKLKSRELYQETYDYYLCDFVVNPPAIDRAAATARMPLYI